MYKELNIIEAYNMKKGTEFNIVFEDGSRNNNKFSFMNYGTFLENGCERRLDAYFINAKFIPIQEPVDFMTAVKSGKCIRLEDETLSNTIKLKLRTSNVLTEDEKNILKIYLTNLILKL